VTLTTHPHVVPRSTVSRSYISAFPCCLYGDGWTTLLLLTLFRDDSYFYTKDYGSVLFVDYSYSVFRFKEKIYCRLRMFGPGEEVTGS
jgi:hypothetical protein